MKLAIFDFDGTLFLHETLPFLLQQWKKQKYSRARLYYVYMLIGGMYIWYKLGFGRKHREYMRRTALQKFTRIFFGMTKEQVDIFFEACAAKIIAQFNEKVVSEIKKTKAEGFHTVILSGCYDDLLEYINNALGADTIIGTKLFYKNGFMDTRKELSVCVGSGKAKKIKSEFSNKDIDYSASTAYADSISDMSILELVGFPVAVCPDKELEQAARIKKWRVIK